MSRVSAEAIRRLVEIGLAGKVYPGLTDEQITQAAEAKLGGAKPEPSFRQLTSALKAKGKR